MRKLNVGNYQVRDELAGSIQRQPAVGHRLGLVAVRREKIAEQLDVEGVVLDNQDLGQETHPRNSIRNDLSHATSLDK